MNPIKKQEYEEYRQTQRQNGKEFQWNEFLNFEKKQYLNFRVSIYRDIQICLIWKLIL
jgi:hypothetical protein